MSTVFSSSLFFPFALPPSLYATSDTHQEEEQQELQTTTAIEIDAKNSPPVPSSKSDRASWGLKRYLPYCWRNHGSPPSHPLPSYSVLDQTVSCCYGDDKKGEMLIVPTPRENFPPLTPGKESCLTHRGLYDWEILTARAAKILTARTARKEKEENGSKGPDKSSNSTCRSLSSRLVLDPWVSLNSVRTEACSFPSPSGRNDQDLGRVTVAGDGYSKEDGGSMRRKPTKKNEAVSCPGDKRSKRTDEDQDDLENSKNRGDIGGLLIEEKNLKAPRIARNKDNGDGRKAPFLPPSSSPSSFSWSRVASFKTFLLASFGGVFSTPHEDHFPPPSVFAHEEEKSDNFLYSYHPIPPTLRTTRTSTASSRREGGVIPPSLSKDDPSNSNVCPCKEYLDELNLRRRREADEKTANDEEKEKTVHLLVLSRREIHSAGRRENRVPWSFPMYEEHHHYRHLQQSSSVLKTWTPGKKRSLNEAAHQDHCHSHDDRYLNQPTTDRLGLLLSSHRVLSASWRRRCLSIREHNGPSFSAYDDDDGDSRKQEKADKNKKRVTSCHPTSHQSIALAPPVQFVCTTTSYSPSAGEEDFQEQQTVPNHSLHSSNHPIPSSSSSLPFYSNDHKTTFSFHPQSPSPLFLTTYRTASSSSSSMSSRQDSPKDPLILPKLHTGWLSAVAPLSIPLEGKERKASPVSSFFLSTTTEESPPHDHVEEVEAEDDEEEEEEDCHSPKVANPLISVRFKDKPFQKPSFVPSLDLKRCRKTEKATVPA